ncbi:hypothetical protein ACX40Y_02410 [Sphingomonas sp. RS6]
MDFSTIQGLMVVIGPIVLALVLAWAVIRNKRSRRDMGRTEDATRRNYDAHDAADRQRRDEH